MGTLWETIGRRASFLLDAETAHGMAIAALKKGFVNAPEFAPDPRLQITIAGLKFTNPVGVAAGFDKNADVPDALLGLGFGFTEIGTVTPLPQAGNPKPRIFRLPEDDGVINRLGFNNEGHDAAYARLSKRQRKGIVGVNIGANKDAVDRTTDYVTGIDRFFDVASYFTVNISSPNTPGLRDLQARGQLAGLLARVQEARLRYEETGGRTVPVFLKIAPDVAETDLDDIVAEVKANSIDGIIVSNTTLSRSGLTREPGQAGGLSGRPLFERSTIMLAKTRQRTGKDLVLIGAGGVDSPETALAKIEAGADLVQLYTGMIYRGPAIAHDICKGLLQALDREGIGHISDMRDRKTEDWAAKRIPA